MARAGINKTSLARFGGQVHCFMSDPDVAAEAKARGITRAAVCMEKAADLRKPVVLAVGNAPTALVRLYELMEEGRIAPALIIGVPVGFVNVVASKELIMTGPAPYIVAQGREGRRQRGRRHLQRHFIPNEVSDSMKIQMIGMDHSRAPVEIRERFFLHHSRRPRPWRRYARYLGWRGCVLLSTCNRTELWVSASGPLDLPRLQCGLKGLDPGSMAATWCAGRTGEAVEYLFALASGLRSMILGEDQILAQVKEALSRPGRPVLRRHPGGAVPPRGYGGPSR